ncbi:DNA-(apurinic or apyrimidinic site) lyase [Alteribacillus persepolensis]|uniref:Formamidopyrimidine-DNA glycosylase n=1 Tax=Alteribacillus persepolensis TaxID=568899 RepID=A0A1G8BJT5_9BACI|nr:DNA-formamidopyrimidine glycosylase [Alteribacillus persepolensis]SDH33421.1 DNA-(apurinic or apyrimidinic site) lyase [Alteribacillus persepolensis]
MPELPEVETVRRTLHELVKGKQIKHVEVYWPRIIKRPDDKDAFATLLQGQTIQQIGRRGKFLTFYLDDYALVSHLRMEGKYEMADGKEPDKHTHVRFFFFDNTELYYKDVRKFGTMHLFPKGSEQDQMPLVQLGPEPYEDPSFTKQYLEEVFYKTTRDIKTVLLDQRAVAGLGNIYVDEALFKAGIRPNTKAQDLPQQAIELLHEKIMETIQTAVEKGGSSVRSYVNGHGDMGLFQLELHVYNRQGEACTVCGNEIEKTVVAGRGTHYCNNCQPILTKVKG